MEIVGIPRLNLLKRALVNHMQVITSDRKQTLKGFTTLQDVEREEIENEIKGTRELLDAVKINIHRSTAEE